MNLWALKYLPVLERYLIWIWFSNNVAKVVQVWSVDIFQIMIQRKVSKWQARCVIMTNDIPVLSRIIKSWWNVHVDASNSCSALLPSAESVQMTTPWYPWHMWSWCHVLVYIVSLSWCYSVQSSRSLLVFSSYLIPDDRTRK